MVSSTCLKIIPRTWAILQRIKWDHDYLSRKNIKCFMVDVEHLFWSHILWCAVIHSTVVLVLRVTVYISKLTKNNYGLTEHQQQSGAENLDFCKHVLQVWGMLASHFWQTLLVSLRIPLIQFSARLHEAEAAEKQRELNVVPSGTLSSHVALCVWESSPSMTSLSIGSSAAG